MDLKISVPIIGGIILSFIYYFTYDFIGKIPILILITTMSIFYGFLIKKSKDKKDEMIERYHILFNEMLDGYAYHKMIYDKNGIPIDYKFLDVNPAFERITTLKAKDIKGKTILEVLPDTDKSWIEIYGRIASTGESKTFENFSTPLQKWFEVKAYSPKEGYFICVFSNITEQKMMSEELEKSVVEKDTLLKEIHHRVKNNMQVISSLLGLQLKYIENEKDRELFRESQTRVRSMSLVHDKLYRSKDFVKIDFGDYVEDLVREMFIIYTVNPTHILLDVNIDPDLNINIDHAIPIGLIINELLSNVLKHAFPGQMEGNVKIHLKKEGDFLIIDFADDGIGIQKEMKWEEETTLGILIIKNLVKQIQATVDVNRNGGTAFVIKIPMIVE